MNGADREDHRVKRAGILHAQGLHESIVFVKSIDRAVADIRLRTVGCLAGDCHLEPHGTGHQIAAAPAELADRDGRVNVHAEAAVNLELVVIRILQQGTEAFAAFFPALEHQDNPARDLIFDALEALGSAQQHRRMAVMTAGMGHAFHFGYDRLFPAAGIQFGFLHRQGIDIRS